MGGVEMVKVRLSVDCWRSMLKATLQTNQRWRVTVKKSVLRVYMKQTPRYLWFNLNVEKPAVVRNEPCYRLSCLPL